MDIVILDPTLAFPIERDKWRRWLKVGRSCTVVQVSTLRAWDNQAVGSRGPIILRLVCGGLSISPLPGIVVTEPITIGSGLPCRQYDLDPNYLYREMGDQYYTRRDRSKLSLRLARGPRQYHAATRSRWQTAHGSTRLAEPNLPPRNEKAGDQKADRSTFRKGRELGYELGYFFTPNPCTRTRWLLPETGLVKVYKPRLLMPRNPRPLRR